MLFLQVLMIDFTYGLDISNDIRYNYMFIRLINNIKINNYQLNYVYSIIMLVNNIIVYVLVFFH